MDLIWVFKINFIESKKIVNNKNINPLFLTTLIWYKALGLTNFICFVKQLFNKMLFVWNCINAIIRYIFGIKMSTVVLSNLLFFKSVE